MSRAIPGRRVSGPSHPLADKWSQHEEAYSLTRSSEAELQMNACDTPQGRMHRCSALWPTIITAAMILPLTVWAKAPPATLIRHGRYLVRDVGICADCHTPRGAHGQYIRGEWLRGARLDLAPTHPMAGWQMHSSNLVRLARRWTQAQWIRFLRTGIAPDGKHARPPMPQLRLSYRDALAVTAYLRSLAH